MKIYNLLTRKTEELSLAKLIFLENKSNDYIISIPHSGAYLLSEFKDRFKLSKGMLIGSDLYTDLLYDMGKGVRIIFELNNYQVNVNRFRKGGDSSMPKSLQRDPLHGRFLDGEVPLKKGYSNNEKKELLAYYDRYHELLKKEIDRMKKEKGYALVFDCHAMNSKGLRDAPDKGEERPDFMIGTVDDTSADKRIIDAFEKTLVEEAGGYGLTVKKNHPYKGGAIARIYGNPSKGVHVIMLETKKSIFYNEGFAGEKDSFKLNHDGLVLVNSIVSKAFEAASRVAKNL